MVTTSVMTGERTLRRGIERDRLTTPGTAAATPGAAAATPDSATAPPSPGALAGGEGSAPAPAGRPRPDAIAQAASRARAALVDQQLSQRLGRALGDAGRTARTAVGAVASSVGQALERAAAASRAAKDTVAGLDAALPKAGFEQPWQRDRVLARAASFATRASLEGKADAQALRKQLGRDFAPGVDVELHGVASHFGPETYQAHVLDKDGATHVFVKDGEGRWTERADLARQVAAGKIPSADPGRGSGPPQRGYNPHGKDATATFAVATVKADGATAVAIPPGVDRFDHSPRARPFAVGDEIQVTTKTGDKETRTAGAPYVSAQKPLFGRITGTDGKGTWTVDVDDGGKQKTVKLSDQELRRMNNPHVLRDGDRVDDMKFNAADKDHQRLIADWRQEPAVAALYAARPGPLASPAERAAWERKIIDAGMKLVDKSVRYPGSSEEDRTGYRDRLKEIDLGLADKDVKDDDKKTLTRERDIVQRRLDSAMVPLDRRDRLKAELEDLECRRSAVEYEGGDVTSLDKEIAGVSGRLTELERELAQDDHYHRHLEDPAVPPTPGAYYANGTGCCRHMAAVMQTLMQDAGVDTRLSGGTSNERADGAYRALHLWLEGTLSDGTNLLVDPTWGDVSDLKKTYTDDKRRQEVPAWAEEARDYGNSLVTAPRLVPGVT